MTVKEAQKYLTKEVVKVIAENATRPNGNLKAQYKYKGTSVTYSVHEKDISLFAAMDMNVHATYIIYVHRKKEDDTWESIAEVPRDTLYWYNGKHIKTEIKLYGVDKFERDFKKMLAVYDGEVAKK